VIEYACVRSPVEACEDERRKDSCDEYLLSIEREEVVVYGRVLVAPLDAVFQIADGFIRPLAPHVM
jgi:hypothetical protein